jgi:hypothetical protein
MLATTTCSFDTLDVSENIFQSWDTPSTCIWLNGLPPAPGKVTFSGNRYYSAMAQDKWFTDSSKPKSYDAEGWAMAMGDQGSVATKEVFPDPFRNTQTYMAQLSGEAAKESLLAAARGRGAGEWDERFSALAVIEYIREGFGQEQQNGAGDPDHGQ